jgi:hypothetical protein
MLPCRRREIVHKKAVARRSNPPEEIPADLLPAKGKAALEKMKTMGEQMLAENGPIEEQRFDAWVTTTVNFIQWPPV